MELLDMKIVHIFWDTILDFLDSMHIKLGGGGGARYPRQGIFTPPSILDMTCDMLLKSIK